ncbi:MAG: hypothetical protein HRJ53_12175 [Acidobacteria bacterium Pan2503]|uniref:Uncharacterized protein n=1 Tax=Candidatus Acidiferrum panamense TaxID=2741543 RepID=A0A7V8NQR9_9BACT|nr:hypothetical protein [Candidatus Acidoferrum panamensis]
MDLVAHDRAIADPMYRVLERCGLIETMAALETAIAGERMEDITRNFGIAKNFLLGLRDYARNVKAPDPLADDRRRLDEERQEVANEGLRHFYGGVRSTVNGQVMALINRELRQALAGRKIPLTVANRLRKEINAELASVTNTAAGYADRYEAVMKQRNPDAAVRFIVAAARRNIPGVVRKLVREFNLSGGAGGTGTLRRMGTGGGSARTSGGGTTVAGRPKTADVDFTRTDKVAWLGSLNLPHGEAWLKNGKKAKW